MLSQFHETGTVVVPPLGSHDEEDVIKTGGRRRVEPKEHQRPITVPGMVAQTPEAGPGLTDEERFKHSNAKIARGVVVLSSQDAIVVENRKPAWKLELKVPTGKFSKGESRGI